MKKVRVALIIEFAILVGIYLSVMILIIINPNFEKTLPAKVETGIELSMFLDIIAIIATMIYLLKDSIKDFINNEY